MMCYVIGTSAQQRLETGDKLAAGMNTLVTEDPVPEAAVLETDDNSRRVQLECLARVEQARDSALVVNMLKLLGHAADSPGLNLMLPLIDNALAYRTGQIVHTLKDARSGLRQPVVF